MFYLRRKKGVIFTYEDFHFEMEQRHYFRHCFIDQKIFLFDKLITISLDLSMDSESYNFLENLIRGKKIKLL